MSGSNDSPDRRGCADPWWALRRHTPARIALGRSGSGLPTHELLRLAAAHAQARDAVHVPLDTPALATQLQAGGWLLLQVRSRASNRADYLRRPDWGRRLDDAGAQRLADWAAEKPTSDAATGATRPVATSTATVNSASLNTANLGTALSTTPSCAASPATTEPRAGGPDLAIVLGDGLSALALQRHAPALLAALREALCATPGPALRLAPLVLATQARVALADEVGQLLQARLVLMLLGERPGLSAADSLGAYLTHAPRVGCTDAQRNCVSNIRPEGLPPGQAAARLAWLVREALRRRVTGVALKDDSSTALLVG